MAGPQKKRAQKERKEREAPDNASSSNKESSSGSPSSDSPTSGSPPGNFDGNRDPTRPPGAALSGPGNAGQVQPIITSGTTIMNRNIDIGGVGAMMMEGLGHGMKLPRRPATLNKTGNEVEIKLNTYHVQSFPTNPIFQYDVSIGTGTEKRGTIKKVWNTQAVRSALGPGVIFDGNKLAWSPRQYKDGRVRIEVDLDTEQGKEPRKDKATGNVKGDKHNVFVIYTKTINFQTLSSYLDGQTDFDVGCLEAINFLDHLLRETPSQRFIQIRRSFFDRGLERKDIGKAVEVFKGVYASVRFGHMGPNTRASLTVNVDVANCAFFKESTLVQAGQELLCGPKESGPQVLARILRNGREAADRMLWQLKRLMVYCVYLTNGNKEEGMKRMYKVVRFSKDDATTNMVRHVKIGDQVHEKISLQQFFLKKYNIKLQHPNLPVVETAGTITNDKGQKSTIFLPMELCYIKPAQKYPYKLDENQTRNMMGIAVEKPPQRWSSVENGRRMLNETAPSNYLSKYGMKISDTPSTVKGRVLPAPIVQFKSGQAKPGTSGRWQLTKMKFLTTGYILERWAVCIVPGGYRRSPDSSVVKSCMTKLRGIMQTHGMTARGDPYIGTYSGDMQAGLLGFFKSAMADQQCAKDKKLQLVMFVLPEYNKEIYGMIKKHCECNPKLQAMGEGDAGFGVVSSCFLAKHLEQFNEQFCSNICAKINAKLGGVTMQAMTQAKGPRETKPNLIPDMTAFIGADVTHGAPIKAGGVAQSRASVAAMTMSADKNCIKYWADAATNGIRLEMIKPENITRMVGKMANQWGRANGRLPATVVYVRDGVSEGEYNQVLNQELTALRQTFEKVHAVQAKNIKYVVIVGTKRHHVRFFPKQPDKNGNALPGTLVETGVTHPREYDFYLCAHNAIKGTARPMHYQVIHDECGWGPEQVQNMIYEASYQYVKSTTPVSIFPAAYYAHIAAERGRNHESEKALKAGQADSDLASNADIPTYELVPFVRPNNTESNMWYC